MLEKPAHWAWSLVLLAACNQGHPNGVVPTDLPLRMAQARCDALHACVAGEVELFLHGQDCTITQQRVYEDSELGDLQRSLDAGALTIQPGGLEACYAAIRNWGCLAYSDGLPPECEQALQGTVPLGAACNHDFECALDGWCDFENGCPGTCAPPKPAGEFCLRDHECQPGLQCDDTCHVPIELGQECAGQLNHSDCRHGEYCVQARCVTFDQLLGAAPGQPCDPERGQWCQIGLTCQVLDFQAGWFCGPLLGQGSPCGLGVPNPCEPGLYCAGIQASLWPMEFITPGVCSPVSQPGQPCEPQPLVDEELAPTQSCSDFHYCHTATQICMPLQRVDGPCQTNQDCYSGVCSGVICLIAHECI